MAQLLDLTVLGGSLAILVILLGVPVAGVASFRAMMIAKKNRPANMLALILTARVAIPTRR
jgi:hypothetical protein